MNTQAQEVQFYRRTLPEESCISFNSEEGKSIFKEAMMNRTMECYFSLAAQFRTQDEPAFCGLTSLVMVLNALAVDPGRVWKGPWRWYHETMLECCIPIHVIEQQGITIKQFSCLATCNSLKSDLYQIDDSCDVKSFRALVHKVSQQEDEFIVCSYSRKTLKQTGDGHFSPIGGYHVEHDLVLILDTARFKYPPHWVALTLLWEAMAQTDKETGQPRGYCLLSRNNDSHQSVLFRIAPALAINAEHCTKEAIKSFINDWQLSLKATPSEDSTSEISIKEHIEVVVGYFIKCVAELTHDIHQLLTTQGEIKCETTADGNVYTCAIHDILSALEQTLVFGTVAHVYGESTQASQFRTCQICVESSNCCEQMVKVAHFVSMFLLAWPYKREGEDEKSFSSLMTRYVDTEIQTMPGILLNDLKQLQNGFIYLLPDYCSSL